MTALAPHLSAYLREHLPRERAVSPHTVKTYANCFVLLVQFAADRLKRRPTDLAIEDLDLAHHFEIYRLLNEPQRIQILGFSPCA